MLVATSLRYLGSKHADALAQPMLDEALIGHPADMDTGSTPLHRPHSNTLHVVLSDIAASPGLAFTQVHFNGRIGC